MDEVRARIEARPKRERVDYPPQWICSCGDDECEPHECEDCDCDQAPAGWITSKQQH